MTAGHVNDHSRTGRMRDPEPFHHFYSLLYFTDPSHSHLSLFSSVLVKKQVLEMLFGREIKIMAEADNE